MTKAFAWPVLLALSVVWILAFRLIGDYAVWTIPEALRQQLTLEAYLTIVQLFTLAFGIGLSALFVSDVPRFLGLRALPPSGKIPTAKQSSTLVYCTVGLLAAAAVYAVTQAVAVQIAIPTLLDEIRRGGRELAQSNSGQFGRELVTSPLLLTLFWGAIVSPVCEELLFRGALWSALDAMLSALTGSKIGREWLTGSVTTVLVALIFAGLHADMQGGLGIVRTVSAFGLAIACGAMRQVSKSVLPALTLHVAFNTISIAATRHFFDSASLGKWLWVPTPIWVVAAAGMLVTLVFLSVQSSLGQRDD